MIRLLALIFLLLIAKQRCDAAKLNSSPVAKKVLIVRAGPAGLLAVHCLLSRNSPSCFYQVHLVDARGEPAEEGIGPRTYMLGINPHGQDALRYFDTPARSHKLLDHVKALSVATDSTFIHVDFEKLPMRRGDGKEPKQPPSL